MSRRVAAVEPLPFSHDAADESLCASSDYFWMLRTGIVEKHAREVASSRMTWMGGACSGPEGGLLAFTGT
jgi:hypothetical protein